MSLGVFQICNRQFQAAAGTAFGGLQLDPTSVDLKAILVLSHCLCSQLEKAEVIVRENQDLSVGRNLSFPEAVLDDLHQLRKRGLTDLGVERLEERWLRGSGKASE